MNMIKGRVEVAGEHGRFVFAGGSLSLPCPAAGDAILGLRAEHLHVATESEWRGVVLLVEPTGADTYVVVRTPAGDMTSRTKPHAPMKEGDPIGLEISGRHTNWFDATTGLRLAL